jgi:uncharacterized protein (DUF779 family)
VSDDRGDDSASPVREFARVAVTPAAAAEIRRLRAAHGALLFHQSGGCCDGSAPMCYPRSDFRVGQRDVFLGAIEETPFYGDVVRGEQG